MNTKFYLLFILFSFQILWAQSVEPAGNTPETKAIDKELNKILKDSKTFIDPKHEPQLLKLKSESQKYAYEDGVLRSGDYLMGLYMGIEEDKKVIELGNELKKTAKNKKDTYGHISNIYRRSALVLGYFGLPDASLMDFRKAISYASEIENNDKKRRVLATTYENMNIYYESRKKEKGAIDSMYSNYMKSLKMAKMISNRGNIVSIDEKYDLIAYNNMQVAILYLDNTQKKDRLSLAEKHLLDALEIYENKNLNTDPVNKAQTYNVISRLYLEEKKTEKSIEYSVKALNFEKQHSNPNTRLQSYKLLLEAYLEKDDNENSKFYQSAYTILNDSLYSAERKASNSTMKKMVAEVDTENKENYKNQWIITGAFILIAGLATIILWRRNNKKLQKNYELMIDNIKNESVPHTIETNTVPRNLISSDTEKRILDQLEAFENSEEFLKPNLTISLLSTQLNTNAKYLSEIIKNHKSHSFSSYSNSLKINYIVHKLYNEPKYRNYKISHLSEICGYASPQVFFVAFKKINGVTPAYFIQKLNEDNILTPN
jgi:AraC-like DNA-binding protein